MFIKFSLLLLGGFCEDMSVLKQRILYPRNYTIVLKFCIDFGCGYIAVLL